MGGRKKAKGIIKESKDIEEIMWRGILHCPHFSHMPLSSFFLASSASQHFRTLTLELGRRRSSLTRSDGLVRRRSSSSYQASGRFPAISAGLTPLDLTEDNVKQVLVDARSEFGQMFDTSVGITGEAKLAEVDGPFVKIALTGRFWHKRSTVLDRISNYLKQRIPEILEVDIEDEKQLDDSPENF